MVRAAYLATILCALAGRLHASVRFADVSAQTGIEFRHEDGRSGEKYFVETLGAGAAWFDYDRDGDIDIYFVNGADLPGKRSPSRPTNALYRNDGGGQFVDVTAQAGVGHDGYGFSCAVGDYDNDGYRDLYVANYEEDVLYRNNGDGTFDDVTAAAGIANTQWAAAAAFADYDGDGDIDLFVANYVEYDLGANPRCGTPEMRLHCSPDVFAATQSVLYANNSDGTFTDVTAAAGLATAHGKAMGVVWSDYDNDGDTDLFVANDRMPDRLYRNNGDGTFTDLALMIGVALSADGLALSSMAAAFGDVDNDGWMDLSITNYHDEPNMLFMNGRDGFFSDVTYQSGVGGSGLNHLSWGGDFGDVDSDGDLDLFVANGHMDTNVAEMRPSLSYAQPNQLFLNRGDASFYEASPPVGDGLHLTKPSRGTAFGDYDNDGDLDLLITNCGEAPDLLRNDTVGGHWLMFDTVGRESNRDGIGARVRVFAGGVWQMREVRSGSSYPSHSDMRLHFGLGDASSAERVEIRWPSGLVEQLRGVSGDRLVRLEEGAASGPQSR
jgi:enediyne biosynthesis protein E4